MKNLQLSLRKLIPVIFCAVCLWSSLQLIAQEDFIESPYRWMGDSTPTLTPQKVFPEEPVVSVVTYKDELVLAYFNYKDRNVLVRSLEGDSITCYEISPAGNAAFTSPDYLAEWFPDESPYSFCAANPIMYIDPTGLERWYTNDPRIYHELEEFILDYFF